MDAAEVSRWAAWALQSTIPLLERASRRSSAVHDITTGNMINLDVFDCDGITWDAWVTLHIDGTQRHSPSQQRRDLFGPLTWPQWAVWQAWAICGVDPDRLPQVTLVEARRRLLDGVVLADARAPKHDSVVPALSEGALIRTLDEEILALWLNHYIHGRTLEALAGRRGCTPRAIRHRLAGARASIRVLLPPGAVGVDIATAQSRLTI